jgi:trimeric autotransporter adhesin
MFTSLLQLFTLNSSATGRPLRNGLLLLVVSLAWLTLSPAARAVTPAPDGGYPIGNTAEGQDALFSLITTTGNNNTALGYRALYHDTTGSYNTATGSGAMFSNTIGFFNTASGYHALYHNIDGDGNTATGLQALLGNTSGSYNTANGESALLNNTTGTYNTANGYFALFSNKTGYANTANGNSALQKNKTGIANTANGNNALFSNETGGFNTANGANALQDNTTGGGNAASGSFALFNNSTGSSNTADGFDALFNNTTGSRNIAVGVGAGGNLTTGDDNIDIGAVGIAGESGKIRIGKQGTQNGTFIAGISGVTVTGTQVVVNSNGKLGITGSSARFKKAAKSMGKASEAIHHLQPVTFRYKEEIDPDGIPQFGLIAEDVEKVNADLVVRDEDGKVITVRYDAVNAMLLNEFLKEHRKVQDLEKQVAALTVGLQKVAAQIESRKAVVPVAMSNR